MQLFIDTNIYLAFYQLTNEDLEELDKLAVLVQQGKVTLHVTHQVKDEFFRNREIKIADAIKRLSEQRLDLKFPHMCKDYPEYPLLREFQKSFEESHASLIKKVTADSECSALKADKTIHKLFTNANLLERTPEIVNKAQYRINIGNPPGKNGSLGDALNWEILLKKLPETEALYFISEDRDYSSALSEGKFKEFLSKEWKSVKNSDVFYYKKLSLFFKDKFPQIKLASELEKNLLLQKLASSGNFAATHELIANLSGFSDFTATEANTIIAATLSNSQIRWIVRDDDVRQFLARLFHKPL